MKVGVQLRRATGTTWHLSKVGKRRGLCGAMRGCKAFDVMGVKRATDRDFDNLCEECLRLWGQEA